MDRIVLNKLEIENSNKNIQFYIDEEFKTLSQINNSFLSLNHYYKSSNFNITASKVEKFENSINTITAKRKSYLNSLKSIINKYISISKNVKKMMDKE